MAFEVVAQGNSLGELAATVADFELKKGTKIRFEMDLKLPVASLFDVAGVEHLFSIDGVDIKDVYGEGWSKAVIEAEADPAWLAAIVLFVRAHWVAILIGMFVLGILVSGIVMSADIADIIPPLVDWTKWVVIGFAVVLGYKLLRKKAPT